MRQTEFGRRLRTDERGHRKSAGAERGLSVSQCLDSRQERGRQVCRFWFGFTAAVSLRAHRPSSLYHGEWLAKKGVVVVSIAYRLGVFGFLAHPELSAESPQHVSGNYGILDMIAGLQWVQKNISTFGGDPKRVTIQGESAGAAAVSILCASPLTKGLFRGAIAESGGSFGPVRADASFGESEPLASAEKRTVELALIRGRF